MADKAVPKSIGWVQLPSWLDPEPPTSPTPWLLPCEVFGLSGLTVADRMYERGCNSALGIFPKQGQEKEKPEQNKQMTKPQNTKQTEK